MEIINLIILSLALISNINAGPLTNPLNNTKITEKADPDYRLSTDIIPSKYTIKVTPYLLKAEAEKAKVEQFTFAGESSIILQTSKENIKTITLHMKNLKIDKIFIKKDLKEDEKIELEKCEPDVDTDKCNIVLKEALEKDVDYELSFIYAGVLDNDMHGFYRSSYTHSDGTTRWIASTQFEPVYARRVFPCFDEPQFKARFTVTINRHKSFNAVSNTDKAGDPVKVDDREIDTFQETPHMSTYLLAFLVSDFKERSSNENPENKAETELKVIAREDAYGQTVASFEAGEKLLKTLDKFTNRPYAELGISKMHLAAIPDFSAGAMENWGLLTFRERALLYEETETSESALQSIIAVIAHEQAHMWFGDSVTCEWWSYTWLNEGFARYFQYFTTAETFPELEMEKQFTIDQIQSVFNMDSLPNSHPLTNPSVKTPADIKKMFDSISYNKGATIIRMIKHAMGPDNFQSAIREYLNNMNGQTSTPQNLYDNLAKFWPEDTKKYSKLLFDDWTTQVGYPLITIKMHENGKSFEVTQKRFLLKEDTPSTLINQFTDLEINHNYADDEKLLTYTVPLSFTTDLKPKFDEFQFHYIAKTDKTTKIELEKETKWIIANLQQVGYYRVNYDDKTWHNIHHALHAKNYGEIHEMNRAQIIDDLMNFGRAGLHDYEFVLNILEYLENELNYLPWTAAFNGFSYLEQRIGKKSSRTELQKYILKLIEQVYKKLNELNVEGDGDKENVEGKPNKLDIYNQPKVLSWACKFGHKECIELANKLFKNLKDNQVAIGVNLRSAVYCSAIRQGNQADYEYLVEKYEKSKVATEQVLILGALGCVNTDALVKKQYKYILSEKVRLQDRLSALTSLYSNNYENPGRLFKLIDENYSELNNALNENDASSVVNVAGANFVSSLANYHVSDAQVEDYTKFIAKHDKDLGEDGKKVLAKAILNIHDNLKWETKYLPKLDAFFKTKNERGAAVTNHTINILLISITFLISKLFA